MHLPLRVLHVVTSLEPGGMENGIVNVANALESRGIETHIACLERRGALSDRLRSPRIDVLGKKGGFSLQTVARLARRISTIRPDIVHTHNLGPLIYAGLGTAFGSRCAVVHGEHSQLTPEELGSRRQRQRRWLYRCSRQVVAVSQGIRDQLLDLGFPPRLLEVIANGVDLQRFRPGNRAAARKILGLPTDAQFVGIVGRFGPFKRHDVLIAAFERIAPLLPSAHLLVAGSGGSEERRITELARTSSFSSRIHLQSFRQEPTPYYQALDLLAVPSVNEGMSNAALEAMACAVPALVNQGCGHEQIVSHAETGVIANLETPESMAAELFSLLAQPARLAEYGRSARQTVENRFSLEAMVDAYRRLYHRHASNAIP